MEWFTYNCLGGLSLWVARLFGVLGWPAVLVATKPKFHSVEMAGGHPLLLVRSTFLRHVDAFDVLLGEAIESFVSSSVRALASSCMRSSSNRWCGNEDDRETFVWTALSFSFLPRVPLHKLQCTPYLL